MKKQFYTVLIIALISILSFAIISNSDYNSIISINAQSIALDSDTNDNNLKNITKVRVGDIDISYKTFGNGNPILLIMG